MTELISSSSNPLVKQIRALRQRKGRDETGLFLVEGILPVGEAIEAGWEIERLIHAPGKLTSGFARRMIDEQALRGVRSTALTPELFNSLAEKDNPQSILAIVRQRHINLEDEALKGFHFGMALVSPQDPGNVGTILRNLDAAGADGLFLLNGGVDPYQPSSVRASMGTIFWKPIVEVSFEDFNRWRRAKGFDLIGSSAHAETDYRTFKRSSRPTILLMGNEQKGLSPEQMTACDASLSIPMKGRASSLNLAVAAGILLFAIAE